MPYLSALVSGLLLALALRSPAFSWLAVVALIPLLYTLINQTPGPRKAIAVGWVCGITVFGIHFRYALQALDGFVFVVLLAYVSLYIGLFALGVTVFVRRDKEWGFLLAPFLWTALEYIRSHLFTGLQIGSLSASQALTLPVVQFASIAGVFGISFLLVAINSLFTRFLFPETRSGRNTIIWTSTTATVTLSVITFGYVSLRDTDQLGQQLRIATMQAAIDERQQYPDKVNHHIIQEYRKLASDLDGRTLDLTILPETMTGSYLSSDSAFLSLLADMGRETGSAFILGSRHLVDDSTNYGLYNSALLVESDGQITDRYDKVRLVPFGEFTPFAAWIPWLTRFRLSPWELTPGSSAHVISSEALPKIGTGICYEVMYSGDMRELVYEGAKLLVIISDDYWFHGTDESRQYFNEAILRAVENGVPVVRCANMGISGIIDARGRVLASGSGVPGQVLMGSVEPGASGTIYGQVGDLLPWASLVLCAVALPACVNRGKTANTP